MRGGRAEERRASWQPLRTWRLRLARRAKPGSWCRRSCSKALSLRREEFRSGNFQRLAAIKLLKTGEEIRAAGGGGRRGRQQAGNHAFALGNDDFFSGLEKVFDRREAITQVAN